MMDVTSYHPTLHAHELTDTERRVRQLIYPIRVPVKQRVKVGRRRVTQWTEVTHPGLLLQLQSATGAYQCGPRGQERRRKPGSCPPGSLDAADLWLRVHRGIADWRNRLGLQGHSDQGVLAYALQELPGMPADMARQFSVDVHRWWKWAVHVTGWSVTDLT